MVAECNIGFEKLLKHILSFSAKKDEQMIDHAQISLISKVNPNSKGSKTDPTGRRATISKV